ncbi:MAG: hypothetical protein ACFE95_00350, partial [Candidatus Hodarchaeota archaeon]
APVQEDDFDFDQYTIPDEQAIDQFDPMAFTDINSTVEESIKEEDINNNKEKKKGKKKKSKKGNKEKSEEKSN